MSPTKIKKEDNMCCTFTASEMSNTRIYVGEAQRQGKLVHVLAYQNTAISKGPNAMVLPFPTETKLGQENVIDTTNFKNFLEDIGEASRHITKGFSGRRGMTLGAAAMDADGLRAEVFDSGSYTIVLATNVWQIPEALSRVPAEKRPNVSSDFLIGYNDLYEGQPIAVCCWDGSIEAEPMMWWYEPSNPNALFIPTMDAHDGKAPKLGVRVDTDHLISVGSTSGSRGDTVRYRDAKKIPDAVKELLPLQVHGKKLQDRVPNGDCFVSTSTLHTTREQLFSGGAPAVELVRLAKAQKVFSTVMNGWS
jgi:hypothetical protein